MFHKHIAGLMLNSPNMGNGSVMTWVDNKDFKHKRDIQNERNSMKTIQYKNHAKQKESFIENESFQFSRFQDPMDSKWYAFVESKVDNFFIFSGPFKKKMTATNQVKTWMNDESINF